MHPRRADLLALLACAWWRSYPPRAAVIHLNSFWFARVTNQTVEPGSDEAVWMKLVHGEDAATLSNAMSELTALRDAANAIANAPENEDLGDGRFSANHHRLQAASARAGAEGARDAAGDFLALTIAASEALTPICALHDLQYQIPAGWWDTFDRLPATNSLLSTTSTYAIICNWNPVSLVAGVDGSVPSLDQVFSDTDGTTPAAFGGQIARLDDAGPNGRNAVQPGVAFRPVFGREPITGRRNFLVRTEEFGAAGWVRENISASGTTVNLTAKSPFSLGNIGNRFLQNLTGLGNRLGRTFTATVLLPPKSMWSDPDAVLLFGLVGGIAGAGVELTATDDYQLAVDTRTVESSGTVVSWVLAADRDVTITGIGRVQLEEASAATAYQRVGSALDVTEAGVQSVRFIRFDLSDDVLPTVFPDGFAGDVFIAGRNGSWIERGVTVAPGGSLNIGPSTLTGGPAGLLAALGDIVGCAAVERALTDTEIARLVAYHRAKGAKGLLVPGPHLIANFGGPFAISDGWDTDLISVLIDGELRVTPLNTSSGLRFSPTITLEAGIPYIIERASRVVSGGGTVITFLRETFGAFTGRAVQSVASTSIASQVNVFIPTATGGYSPRAWTGSAGTEIALQQFAVRRLIPQEEL